MCAKSVVWILKSGASVGVGGAPSDFVIEGERLCLCRYDAEDIDLGGGRPMAGDLGASSLYDELRLRAGLVGFDDAGDCCDGGVYGISSPARVVGGWSGW